MSLRSPPGFVQKLAVFFSCILFPNVVFSFYRTYVLSYSLIGGDHIQMKIQQNMSLMEKLTILSDAAKYDVACTSSGVDRGGDGIGLGNSISVGSVILFPQMDGVFPFSRFYLQTNVFLTALTARIIVTPMSGGLPLPRRKSAN